LAKDASGVVIPNTYIVVQDYAGVNYDYNDNIFLVENVRPLTQAEFAAFDKDGNGRVDGYDDADGDGIPNVLDQPTPVQTAFTPTKQPWAFTAGSLTLKASNFDDGGQGVAYNDQAGLQGGNTAFRPGRDVEIVNTAALDTIGWIANGEWVEYTINVQAAGTYSLVFNTATPDGGRTITASFEQNGIFYRTTAAITVPDTDSYTAFANTQAATVDLAAGVQTVRVAFGGGAMDFKSFTLAAVTAPAPTVSIAAQSQTVTEGVNPPPPSW
jgi:hypothetical protein